MPQDQDDIKGADAMKQAPTPGLLSGDDVKLLVKGDVISHPKWGVSTYLPDTNERPAGLVGPWSFIGRPDADGWMPWSGGENPVPGQAVEVKWRDGRVFIGPSDDVTFFDWRHMVLASGSDIIAFRLAPTVPVEVSGSERWVDALEALDWIENVFPGPGDTNDQGVTVMGWHRLDQACATIRAVLSRPQPSGETREIAWKILEEIPAINDLGSQFQEDIQAAIVTALEYSRPAPVASGGQHSCGEVDRAWLIDIINEHSFASDAADMILERLNPAPVAETAGEAVAWLYTENRWKDGPRHRLSMQRQSISDDDKNEFEITEQPLYAAPVPAQDDDKMRKVLEEAHSYLEVLHSVTANATTRSSVWKVIKRVRAALKSTAAQEGGE